MKTTTGSSRPQPPTATEAEVTEKAALQAAHVAVIPKHRRVWPWVLATQAAVLSTGYLCMPFFTTHLVFDREAMAAEEAAVSERARAYREREEVDRARREIHEEHVDPLKWQEREKRRMEILDHVNELKAIAERLRDKRDEQLTRLMEIPAEAVPEEAQLRLAEALKTFAEVLTTIKGNEKIEARGSFGKTADELLAQAEATRRKANAPTGLDPRDREAMSERLAETESALRTLREANRDAWSGGLGSGLGDAQEMANLLRGVPNQLRQARQQQQTADTRMKQQRDRLLDEIKREIDRIEQSHRGLLSQKNTSPEVRKLAEALDAMQLVSQQQKTANRWDHAELNKSFDELKAAAGGTKEHIRDIHELGDQRETQGLVGILNKQQRQADTQRKQREQLQGKHAGEAERSDQAVNSAIDKARAQWAKTGNKLDPAGRAAHEQAVGKLLKQAAQQVDRKNGDAEQSPSTRAFKAEVGKVAEAVKQEAGDDRQVQGEAEGLRKALEHLANEVGKHEQIAQKHASEQGGQLNRIRNEWRNAAKQLNDKATRSAPALKPDSTAEPRDPSMAKVRDGLRQLDAQSKHMLDEGGLDPKSVTAQLNARSKALNALKQDATALNQTQRKMQTGITRDEATKLDRNLANLASNLGRKSNDVKQQAAQFAQAIERQEAGLQESLARIKQATAKASKLDSSDAKSVADTLAPALDSATDVLDDDLVAQDAFQDRITRAQEQTGEWLRRASGEAPPRQQQMAKARQKLRELSEAMAESGISRQNADAAAALLDMPPPDCSPFDLSDLDGVVAAAETMHDRIEDDFQAIRAAEIAARTNQSFEHMQRLADSSTSKDPAIEVPNAGTEIDTVGDLNSYRKAMDAAVAQTEGLAQNARTMQRQALGEDDPTLARALQQARAAAQGQEARSRDVVNVGRDPRGGDHRSDANTWHQMTFEKTRVRTKRLDVEKIKAEALPGRRFTGESPRRGWLYVDTWYVIGPWENHGKIDWINVHAPEFETDLAKTYPDGKGGRELCWQFTQNPTIRCDVPDEQVNSTYYAYTEVYFDQAREMLVAIASNDAGKLWIDDTVIWQDDGLSIWNMDEGFRRVRFKKGFSKVLMRVENGPRFCQYSLLLCPPDL